MISSPCWKNTKDKTSILMEVFYGNMDPESPPSREAMEG
jgi:hypothetical protein